MLLPIVAVIAVLLIFACALYVHRAMRRLGPLSGSPAASLSRGRIYIPGDMPAPPDFASVAVVGCARNVARELGRTKEIMESLRSLFASSRIAIYENDSTDLTLEILRGWADEGFCHLISEKHVAGTRTQCLAHGRNLLMRWAVQDLGVHADQPPTYVIVMDMDSVNADLLADAVLRCFSVPGNWGMIGANQRGAYYDLWALRTFDDWMPFDCWECVRQKGKRAREYCVGSRGRKLAPEKEPFEVISCFGGFGLYKTEFLLGQAASPPSYFGDGYCEHVSFNEGVRANGGAILIAPFLINH